MAQFQKCNRISRDVTESIVIVSGKSKKSIVQRCKHLQNYQVSALRHEHNAYDDEESMSMVQWSWSKLPLQSEPNFLIKPQAPVTTQKKSVQVPEDWRTYRAQLFARECDNVWSNFTSRNASDAPTSSSPSAPGLQPQSPSYPTTVSSTQSTSNMSSEIAGSRTQPVLQRPSRTLRSSMPEFDTQRWAHFLRGVEVGCLLVARSSSMGFFNNAVVLVTAHEPHQGSLGYVLNKSAPLHVKDLKITGDAHEPFLSAFSDRQLSLGGPVNLDHVTLLHRYQGLAQNKCVVPGLYTGGLPSAVALCKAGLASPTDFQLFLGMAGWGAGQLEAEVAKGMWHVVSASVDIILQRDDPEYVLDPSNPACCSDLWATTLRLANEYQYDI